LGGVCRMHGGVSVQFAFGNYMAQVAEVSVDSNGKVQVHRVVCAGDCGQGVNPDTVVAQIESGIVFGLSAGCGAKLHLTGVACSKPILVTTA